MSINLITAIQKNLDYAPLQKIDANKQDITEKEVTEYETLFGQAAIPAILIGLHRYASIDNNAINILRNTFMTDWSGEIFKAHKNEVALSIVSYSGISHKETFERMNVIAEEAIRLIRQQLPPDRKVSDVKNLLNSQRHDILTYLPAPLHIGPLLEDSTLDDNTNKMEGPVSNLMHFIGKTFSKPVTEKELQNKDAHY